MNLRQLEYFVCVAEHGSFSQAARVLNVAQPALSRQVRLLETDLREALLLRTGRGVVPTEAGRRLFEHAVAILQLVDRAREQIRTGRNEPAGRIVVALPPSLGRALTLRLAAGFRSELPRAHLAIVEGMSAHIAEWIATGRVDLGVVYNLDASPAIETVPILEEPLYLVGPASAGGRSVCAEGESVRLAQLPGFPLIIPERTHVIRKLLEARAALAGIKLDVAWEVSSVPAILDLVSHGYGFAVLPYSAVTASGRPEQFRARTLVEPALSTTLFLAVSASKPATPLTLHTMRMLQAMLAPESDPERKQRPAHNALR
ncbi:MAG: LysR family transcriptional regulator [Burkholderiales bacterium]|nr:MAG: LysR family transcriptional regulator [Burkholderiales bacterium]